MSPLGLKGPCSQNAPAPIDEQPGPSKFKKIFFNSYKPENILYVAEFSK